MSIKKSAWGVQGRIQREGLATLLLAAMIVLAALSGSGSGLPMWPAGLAAWLACLTLWPKIGAPQQHQALWLAGIGLAAMIAALTRGADVSVAALLTQNTALLGMLGAVGFLQLLGRDDGGDELPQGKAALWRTAFGAHLLGAVINLSIVFIMADKIRGKEKPTPEQAMILVRSFLAAALWSPFFAATAVALTYAPGANPLQLSLSGMFLAAVLLALAVRDLAGQMGPATASFVGFPMRLGALGTPILLACLVAAGHGLLPHWGILAVISVAALMVVALALARREGCVNAGRHLVRHARSRLPSMSGELALFLSAGVFASGLRALIDTGSVWLPFAHFGGPQAALVLAMMILLAAVGIHAVISITMVATWLAPLHPAPDLLALVFVMSWAIGLAAGPLSGIHLAIQGRYGISARMLARGNIRYCLQAYAAAVIYLLLIAQWVVRH